MASFIDEPPSTDFSLANLPFGVCSRRGDAAHPRAVCTIVGDTVVDLDKLAQADLFSGPHGSAIASAFRQGELSGFMQLGQSAWKEARACLQRLLSASEGVLRDNSALRKGALVPVDEVEMHVSVRIGDYTDFYASRYHATNVGAMFRGVEKALQPNWLHLPVGYHGRASSIVASGTTIQRPWGQVLPPGADFPRLQACKMLDFELEMACFIGTGNSLGQAIPVDEAREHVFGFALMNDWSARDIQKWEYVPLGPFNSKNFATTLSPWIVTAEALQPFTCDAPVQEPVVLEYLRESNRRIYDISMTVDLQPQGSDHATTVTKSNFKHLYWTPEQMVAHHTVTGCNLCPGDVLGSGTISGPDDNSLGCMLELSKGGSQPVALDDGSTRTFLQDGDNVIIRGCAGDPAAVTGRVGFGLCAGRVTQASAPPS